MKLKNVKTQQTKKIIQTFIDTNIFLEYFEMSSATLEPLNTLLNLLKEKRVQLIITKQIKDEYYRDKSIVINKMKNEMNKLNIHSKLQIPASIKHWEESRTLSKQINKLHLSIQSLFDKYDKEFNMIKGENVIGNIIEKVFENSIIIEEGNDLIDRAYYRYLRGNPPGKNNSFGDAIIWEALLENSNNNLHIITKDIDWYSNQEKTKINDLLSLEWKNKTSGKFKLISHVSLADFINSLNLNGIKNIEPEIVKEEKTEKLSTTALDTTTEGSFIGTIGLWDNYTGSFGSKDYNNCISSTSISFQKQYFCPFCKKNITIELKNDFPFLETMNSNFNFGYYPSFLENNYMKSSSDHKTAKCPYCYKQFNLKNIL